MKFRHYLPASIIYCLPYAKAEDIEFTIGKSYLNGRCIQWDGHSLQSIWEGAVLLGVEYAGSPLSPCPNACISGNVIWKLVKIKLYCF